MLIFSEHDILNLSSKLTFLYKVLKWIKISFERLSNNLSFLSKGYLKYSLRSLIKKFKSTSEKYKKNNSLFSLDIIGKKLISSNGYISCFCVIFNMGSGISLFESNFDELFSLIELLESKTNFFASFSFI